MTSPNLDKPDRLSSRAIGQFRKALASKNKMNFWQKLNPLTKLAVIVIFLGAGVAVLSPVLPHTVGQSPSEAVRNTASPSTEDSTLPPHTVSQTSLGGDAKRIEVESADPDLTREECKTLTVKYAPYARSGGQVVVQKPNPNSPWNGKVLPFCVDNMEGGPVEFNDVYFK